MCDSQPVIFSQLHDDESITLRRDDGPLSDAVRLLQDARRRPDAFGNLPHLYVSLDDEIAGPRHTAMMTQLRAAARAADYQSIQVNDDPAGPPCVLASAALRLPQRIRPAMTY